jgi:exodeoxyribonuclease-3
VDILKIATFNINGIRSRLPALLAWLEREGPDVVCLQELKAPDVTFPINDIHAAGYGAIWHGQTSWNGVAILAKGIDPLERQRGLPGGKADTHSRYLEAAARGVIAGSLYLPNGNPQPGPKFDYKLAWFERLIKYAAGLYDSGHPVVLAGDYNVVPTDEDIYNPRSWLKDALLQPESRECYQRLLAQGWHRRRQRRGARKPFSSSRLSRSRFQASVGGSDCSLRKRTRSVTAVVFGHSICSGQRHRHGATEPDRRRHARTF